MKKKIGYLIKNNQFYNMNQWKRRGIILLPFRTQLNKNIYCSLANFVIPAEAGIQNLLILLGSRFRGNDRVEILKCIVFQ